MDRMKIVSMPEQADDNEDFFIRLTNSHQQQLRREELLRKDRRMDIAELVLDKAMMFLLGVVATLAALILIF